VPYEIILGELLEFLQFLFETASYLFVDSGFSSEDANHYRFFHVVFDGLAKDASVALVEDLQDPVIVDAFPPFANLATARRTGHDFFGHRLATVLTQLHIVFSKDLLNLNRNANPILKKAGTGRHFFAMNLAYPKFLIMTYPQLVYHFWA
jgi:hypothetical protein